MLQVQLPQFRKAGLEVTAVFSRGQQRARQVAEQVKENTDSLLTFVAAVSGTKHTPLLDYNIITSQGM